MSERKLSFQQAKEIPIVEFLSGLGIEPAKIRSHDHWFYSPFREERTPSFKVNTNRNVWFDHGSGFGGTILDLGANLFQCSVSEFLEKLSSEHASNISLQPQPMKMKIPETRLEIISVKELVDADLLYYLHTRCISDAVAKTYCKEVDFRIKDRRYKAIGFPNNSNAFELRNKWFKGSSSPKDISFVHQRPISDFSKLSVLEGFMDFLSLQTIQQKDIVAVSEKSDFLILNSLSMLSRVATVESLRLHHQINLFLDNDQAAKDAKEILRLKGVQFTDRSSLYLSHKDLNDYLQSLRPHIRQSKGLRM